ncbi:MULTISPECIES: MFS transporter [unclassified Janthinobacterium]|uniref:MFS transporter n=1 Tax=unclassified Janthinobacterium TaxID=2610881 RepID=UPI001796FB2E|nr:MULTISPECIES: MFS transporter [unclassified Janthinobacterium]MBB5606540.1 MFS family permease [Janthinobacterium sp. S3T4]MBB5611588.1 MFS family permease [Janthinobacterium sp. S3M3]
MPVSPPSRLSLLLQVLAACLSGLLIPLCFTGPAVVLPALSAELGGSASTLNWVINAYILSYGSAMMVAGSLTDVLGRRRVWLAGLLVFCGATVAIAAAPSVPVIAVLRFVQGLGGAAAFAAAMSSLAPLFQGAARNRIMSLLGTTFGLGLAFGPLAAGAMLELAAWPAVFYATALLGLLGLLLVAVSVPADKPQAAGRLDWPGALSFSAALGLLTFAMLLAPEHGWSSAGVWLPLAVALLLFCLFIRIERKTLQPMLDLSLFRQRRFVGVQVLAASPAFLFIVLIVMLPGRFIGIDGYSPLEAGRLMIALAAPLLCVPMLAALLLRWYSAGTLCAAGLLLTAAGLAWLAVVMADGSGATLVLPLLLIGVGIGLPWGLMDGMALSVVEPARAGMATGIFNTVRVSADGVALAVAGAVLAGLLATRLAQLLPPGLPLLAAASRAALGDLQQAAVLLPGQQHLLRAAYDSAFCEMLACLSGLAVLLAALVRYLLLKRPGQTISR